MVSSLAALVSPEASALSVSSRGVNKLDVFYTDLYGSDYAHWQKEFDSAWFKPRVLKEPARDLPDYEEASNRSYPVNYYMSSVGLPGSNRIDIVSSTGFPSEIIRPYYTGPRHGAVPPETIMAGNLIWKYSPDGGKTWSEWKNLGGSILGIPAITASSPSRLDIFAVADDDALWHIKSDDHGKTWSTWERIGGEFGSSPAAVARVARNDIAGRIDIVGISRDGLDMIHYWGNGIDGKWNRNLLGIGHLPPSANDTRFSWIPSNIWESKPAIASWAPDRLDIFVLGHDGAIYHKYWNGGASWSAWNIFPYTTLGRGSCTECSTEVFKIESGPAAVSWGKDRIDLFFEVQVNIPPTDPDNISTDPEQDLYRHSALVHTYWNGKGWLFPYEELSTTINSEPEGLVLGPFGP